MLIYNISLAKVRFKRSVLAIVLTIRFDNL